MKIFIEDYNKLPPEDRARHDAAVKRWDSRKARKMALVEAIRREIEPYLDSGARVDVVCERAAISVGLVIDKLAEDQ